jgi:hypothetical protein
VGANLSARGNPFVDEHDVAPAYSAKRSLADAEEDFYRRNSSFFGQGIRERRDTFDLVQHIELLPS